MPPLASSANGKGDRASRCGRAEAGQSGDDPTRSPREMVGAAVETSTETSIEPAALALDFEIGIPAGNEGRVLAARRACAPSSGHPRRRLATNGLLPRQRTGPPKRRGLRAIAVGRATSPRAESADGKARKSPARTPPSSTFGAARVARSPPLRPWGRDKARESRRPAGRGRTRLPHRPWRDRCRTRAIENRDELSKRRPARAAGSAAAAARC